MSAWIPDDRAPSGFRWDPDVPSLPGPAPADGGMTYSRFLPADEPRATLLAVEDHVRAHLSSVADADDNPNSHAGDVRIEYVPQPAGVLVVGRLDARPDAPYLHPGYDPSSDGSYTFQRWVPEGVQE